MNIDIESIKKWENNTKNIDRFILAWIPDKLWIPIKCDADRIWCKNVETGIINFVSYEDIEQSCPYKFDAYSKLDFSMIQTVDKGIFLFFEGTRKEEEFIDQVKNISNKIQQLAKLYSINDNSNSELSEIKRVIRNAAFKAQTSIEYYGLSKENIILLKSEGFSVKCRDKKRFCRSYIISWESNTNEKI